MKVKTQYFPQIDALRLMAVVMVIISHWIPDHPINHFQIGRLGVDLFFVISGFLITRVLFQMKGNNQGLTRNLKTFFIRRVLRIFPIYYFVVIITTIFNEGVMRDAFLWNMCYASNFYILGMDHWPGIMSHFWSLSVEEHFYLLWPLLMLLPKGKRIFGVMVGVVFSALLMRTYFHFSGYDYTYSYIFTISCFDALALGGLLAYIYHHPNKELFHKIINNKILITLAVSFFSYCLYSLNYHGFYDTVFNAIFFRFSGAIVFFFIIGNAIESKIKILNNKKIVFLGQLSYSMYLFHNFVPGFLLGMTYPENIYIRIPIYFVVLLLVSYGSWKLIEMPFNKLKHRFSYGK